MIIVDENDCQTILDAAISESSTIEIEVTETINNNCFGAVEGSIQAMATGGDGSLEYTLGTETNTTGLFENLPAGDYEVMVVDEIGCSNFILQNITEPEEIEINASNIQQNNCFGNTEGSVQFTASGGTGNLELYLRLGNQFKWLF